MNKAELRQKLQVISDQYQSYDPTINSGIDDFVNCLDNPDLAAHLLKCEICPLEEELPDYLPGYQTAEAIIKSFQEMHNTLESMDLIEKIDMELSE